MHFGVGEDDTVVAPSAKTSLSKPGKGKKTKKKLLQQKS